MLSNTEITIETKVWEGDWMRLLVEKEIQWTFRPLTNCAIRRVLVNNVRDELSVEAAARQCISEGLFDEVVLVSDYIDRALAHFHLTRESLGRGYVYSSAELVGIITCSTEFLCHFAGDCRMAHQSEWTTSAMRLLNDHSQVAIVNPIWNGALHEALAEAEFREGSYTLGYAFSDQCYLGRTADLAQMDLNAPAPEPSRYPAYGGELFEKRVDAWLRSANRLRAVDLGATYLHVG